MKTSHATPHATFGRLSLIACLIGAGVSVLPGCFPVAATGIVVGAFSISDRRTTGAQAEDQAVELKAFNRFRERFKSDRISLSVTSFNRTALVTGYVPDDATRAEVAKIVSGIENVRTVLNEVVVGPIPSMRTYGTDTVLTTRVKASLIETKDLQANAIKVVTESNTVFLMGIVTEREAKLATDIASRVSGVRRVIRAFEIISEAELARIRAQFGGSSQEPAKQPSAAPQPAAPATPPPAAPAPQEPSGAVVTPIR